MPLSLNLQHTAKPDMCVQSNVLRDTMLSGHCANREVTQRSLIRFVEHGGVRVVVDVLENCVSADCNLQWSSDESFGIEGCMRTFHLLEVIGSADNVVVWQKASDADKGAAIALVVHLIEAAMQVGH